MTERDRLDLPALGVLLAAVAWLHRAALDLPLRNADDWYHLDIAFGLLAGDGEALRRAVFGSGFTDVLRPMLWPLWAGNAAMFGVEGGGYYATNLLLHLLIVAGVYALARQLGGGVGSGIVAGAVVGLNPATGQGTYYLAARYDQGMVLVVLALVLLWPRLRETGRGRAGALLLYAVAILCKPPAIVAPALLMVVDQRRTRLLSFVPFAAVAVGYVALLKLWWPGGLSLAGGGVGGAPVEALTMLVAPGHALGVPSRTLQTDALVWLGPVVFLLGVAAVGAVPGRVARTGLGWLVATLPIPIWFLSGMGHGLRDGGRQMLLPSVGVALLAASCAPRAGLGRRAGWGIGLFVLLAFGWTHAEVAPHFLERDEPSAVGLVEALETVEGPAMVAFQRPGGAPSSLMPSGAVSRLAGERPYRVALQGAGAAFDVQRQRYGYGALQRRGWPPGAVVSESYGRPGDPPTTHPSWVVWTPPTSEVGEVAQRWDLTAGAAGWGPFPPADRGHLGLPSWVGGEGFVVDASIRMPTNEVSRQLALKGKPGVLRSPELEIRSSEVCGLEVLLDASGVQPLPSLGIPLVPERRFAVITWSARADWYDAWRGVVVAPIEPDGRVFVRLDRSLPWTEEDVVRRIGVLASNAPGRVVIREVALHWCR